MSASLLRLEDHTREATHVVPMGNYVIAGVGNYVIENPSNLGNFMIADTQTHTALGDGSTRRLRKISMLSAMSPMRPRRTGSLAQAGNLVPYAHPPSGSR